MKNINYYIIKLNSTWSFIKKHQRAITVVILLGVYFTIIKLLGNDFIHEALALWLFKNKKKSSPPVFSPTIKLDNLHEEKSFLRKITNNNNDDDELHIKIDFWQLLRDTEEAFNDKDISEIQRIALIYKIGEFYTSKHMNFATHIHALFKDRLEEFWKNYDNTSNFPILPKPIEVIYHIIKHKSHQKSKDKNFFYKKNGLSFVDFKLKFANFRYVNFSNENLINVDLTCSDLNNANLSSADLSNANLTDVLFVNSNLNGANLTDANLTDANLDHARMVNTNLTRSNLTCVNLCHADLTRANLTKADLSHTNLNFTNLTSSNLNRTNLSYTELSEANLIGANLNYSNLDHANLTNANLSFTNLTGASLFNTDLSKGNLIGANLKNITNLHNAKLESAIYCKTEDFITLLPHNFEPKKHGMILVDKFGEKINN